MLQVSHAVMVNDKTQWTNLSSTSNMFWELSSTQTWWVA